MADSDLQYVLTGDEEGKQLRKRGQDYHAAGVYRVKLGAVKKGYIRESDVTACENQTLFWCVVCSDFCLQSKAATHINRHPLKRFESCGDHKGACSCVSVRAWLMTSVTSPRPVEAFDER